MFVFIHGINQQKFIGRERALHALWSSLLDIALGPSGHSSPERRMFFYADLTRVPEERVQSPGGRALAEEMALEGLDNDGRVQGVQNHEIVLDAARMIDELPLLERLLGKAILKVFAEEAIRYLEDHDLQNRILDRFASTVDRPIDAIIAHSLGTVIAYQLVCRYPALTEKLVTLGSPLGSDAFLRRLNPGPLPAFPGRLRSWVDISDPNDIVSCRPLDCARLFNGPAEHARLVRCSVTNNTDNRHGIEGYLTQPEIARALG